MAYTKQTWADLPSKTTPINAERLTHIEDGIFNASQTADTAASTAGTAAANVGIVSGRVETLTERVNGLDTAVSNKVDKVTGKGLSTNDYDNTDKGKVDSLGTASTKNSTSVVTDSTDLVESGAVYRAIGIDFKNLLDITVQSGSHRQVNFTINSDKTITANGTATGGNSSYTINEKVDIKAGTYIGSGGISADKLFVLTAWNGSTYVSNIAQIGATPVEFTVDFDGYDAVQASVFVRSGITANNDKFYPMVRNANITDATYEPHHASVDESKVDNSVIGTVEDGTTASQAYAVNDVFIRNGALCKVTSAISQGDTLSNQFTVTNIGAILTALLNA